jgi:hypothetical protein
MVKPLRSIHSMLSCCCLALPNTTILSTHAASPVSGFLGSSSIHVHSASNSYGWFGAHKKTTGFLSS